MARDAVVVVKKLVVKTVLVVKIVAVVKKVPVQGWCRWQETQ